MPSTSGQAFTRIIDTAPAIRRAILAALIVGVPVAFLRVTSDPFNVPKLVLLTIGVAGVAALRTAEVLHGRSWRGLEWLAVPAVLVAVPLIFSWALSSYRAWAILGLQGRFQGLVPYLLVIVFGVLIADAFRGRSGELAFAMVWAGAIVGGYAIVQTIGFDPFDWSLYGAPTEAVSTTGNPNFTGGFLATVLPLGLGLVLTDPGRRRVAVRLLVLTVGGWIVARSQGGWAAGLAGSAIVVGYFFRERYRLAHIAGWTMAAFLTVLTIGVVFVAVVRPESRFTVRAALVRAEWSQAALRMGFAHPVAGRGPNSFAIEGIRHRSQDDALAFTYDFPDDPHSVPMSMFANLGLPGLIGFLGLLAWALWFFFRTNRGSLLQVAFMAGAIAYFVQSLVSIDELTLRVALWTMLGGLISATVVEEKKGRDAAKTRSRRNKSARKPVLANRSLAGLVVVVVALAACIAWAASILMADFFVRQGSIRFSSGDVEGGRAKYATALSLRDSADYRGRLAFALAGLAVNDEGLVDEEIVAAADEAFSFTEQIPYVFSIVRHARLLEEAARAKGASNPGAIALYRRAIELDPRNPLIRVELAQALLRRGQPHLALETLLDLKDVIGQRLPAYWGALALSAARAGELDLAREAIGVAESLEPGQPDATKAKEILESESS